MLLIILELRLRSRKKNILTLHTPTSVYTSHKVLKGNLFNNQEILLAGDHFLNSCGFNVWFRDGCPVVSIQSHFDTVILIQVEVDLLHM